ncbi:NTP transferase domain-containing protein [Sphingomonas sp. PL-96]|uniref:phosphocholine cytidylyltransferase family protein n=1 Tax=Sphingomonas sp. PL-96 TaxID=2887201 RepID=UPI001E398737|nr:NTP transferase domain-containing protein [Sphingomonas sp. PL-96]MCC2975386.1 NTP transferase domain-containing protein [Sphingomonas sp. PL-96]
MIDTAILLAAGEGSRLRSAAPFKPLCTVAGRPLIDHALHGLAAAGMARAVVVLGYGAEAIEAHLAAHDWPVAVEHVRVADYHEPNGVSVLAAQAQVGPQGVLLAMCDHLVDPELYRRMALGGVPAGGAHLAIDRRLDSDWVDLDDVTRVQTQGEHIVAIGKGLEPFDCFDTGVFAIGAALFAALQGLEAPSLTEGMRALVPGGQALVTDCSDLDWIDVDDQAALAKAEAWLGARV